MRAVLEACAVYKVPVYAAHGVKDQTQKQMCEELGIPFQDELYIDVDYTSDGKLVPVPQSKPPTPELVYSRLTSVAFRDTTIDTNGNDFKQGFNGEPFSCCVHSDRPGALQNAEALRKAVNEANAKLFPK